MRGWVTGQAWASALTVVAHAAKSAYMAGQVEDLPLLFMPHGGGRSLTLLLCERCAALGAIHGMRSVDFFAARALPRGAPKPSSQKHEHRDEPDAHQPVTGYATHQRPAAKTRSTHRLSLPQKNSREHDRPEGRTPHRCSLHPVRHGRRGADSNHRLRLDSPSRACSPEHAGRRSSPCPRQGWTRLQPPRPIKV